MTLLHEQHAVPATPPLLSGWFLALELTGRCQLACAHCYAESGPTGDHGVMSLADWRDLLTDARALGVTRVQFIGGEPTLHPNFEEILRHAIDAGQTVEIFTNLYRVRDTWWDLFARPGVSLATSYYSDRPAEHARITGRPDGHGRTRANIIRAVNLSIPMRASIVEILDGQRVEEARTQLAALGVTRVRVDHLRGIGRGARDRPDVSQLCGRCGQRQFAVSAQGDVTPCVMSRWITAGNLRDRSLAEILTGETWQGAVAQVSRRAGSGCNPGSDSDDCAPASTEVCNPAYDD
ncbi:radical SAM protein [Sphaerisporangium perillae]|uniref:radical SAM protein n=1 Tax=Sphaerisporangium perillae TaxID=2935860 RepID=UPI00200C3DFC|nr:radical SAM protein [Sphaerisporangium perillae]